MASSSFVAAFLSELDDDSLDALAALLAPRLRPVEPVGGSPWLNVNEAAEYLRCSRQRIYDLRSAGRLNAAGYDGARPLFHRDDLDAYLTTNQAARAA